MKITVNSNEDIQAIFEEGTKLYKNSFINNLLMKNKDVDIFIESANCKDLEFYY